MSDDLANIAGKFLEPVNDLIQRIAGPAADDTGNLPPQACCSWQSVLDEARKGPKTSPVWKLYTKMQSPGVIPAAHS
jgi:hypothetical protein